MTRLEKSIENWQSKLLNKIHRYSNYLTMIEVNMLKTLNYNCLLLDIDIKLNEIGKKDLVAYNLQRQIVLWKRI